MPRRFAFVALLAAACAGEAPVDIMSDVLATLPAFERSSPAAKTFAPGDTVDDALITQRFALECHWDGESPGACPPGVAVDSDTKYSADTLLGLIAHAEQFTNEIYGVPGAATCAPSPGWAKRTIGLASFVSDDDGGDGARFLVDAFDRFGCVSTATRGRRTAWSVADGTRYETVTFVKGEAAQGADQSFVTQALLLLDSSRRTRVIATNAVGVTITPSMTSTMRSIVVANLANRRFLARTGGGAVGGMSGAGQAGLSPDGVRSSGVWYARSAESPEGACVDNPTLEVVDPARCASESGAWGAGVSPASWLGLSDADAALLEDWLDVWSDGAAATLMEPGEAPSTANDRAHLPDRLE